jgi:hypothetical protein
MNLTPNLVMVLVALFIVVFILCLPSKEHATNITSTVNSTQMPTLNSTQMSTINSTQMPTVNSDQMPSIMVSPSTKDTIQNSGLSREEIDSIIKNSIAQFSNSLNEKIVTKRLCVGNDENTCLIDVDIKKIQGIDSSAMRKTEKYN